MEDREVRALRNVQKVTVRSWWTGANAVRVKCLTMYSNIISSRPHHACDVTLATIFSYEKPYECKRDGDVAGVTPAAAAGNSRGPRKETCKYYNKRKSVVQCAEAAMTVTVRYWTLGCL